MNVSLINFGKKTNLNNSLYTLFLVKECLRTWFIRLQTKKIGILTHNDTT